MQMTPLQCYLSEFHGQNMLRSLGDTAYSYRGAEEMRMTVWRHPVG